MVDAYLQYWEVLIDMFQAPFVGAVNSFSLTEFDPHLQIVKDRKVREYTSLLGHIPDARASNLVGG